MKNGYFILFCLVLAPSMGYARGKSETPKDFTIGVERANQSYGGFAKGPNGEVATSATDISLTQEEYQKVRAGNYKATMLWGSSGEWYKSMTRGAKAEFEKMGIEVVAISESNYDPAKQATDIETALALKPNIMLSLPVDPVASTRAFQPAVDAGVSIVLADNGIDNYKPGEQYVSIVTGDHYGMGRAAADLMAEAIGNKGDIAMIYYDANFFVTNNRDNAFRRTIERKYPNINLVYAKGFSQDTQTGEVAVAMLTQNPSLDGVYVSWDVAAEPVVAEMRSAGSRAKLVTHDLGGTLDLDMAQRGLTYGKVADKPYQIGQVMARLAAYDLLGKPAPPFVLCETVKMTRDNMLQAYKESANKSPDQAVIDALRN